MKIWIYWMMLAGSLVLPLLAAPPPTATRPPNIVIIFLDDAGYADVGCFGAKGFHTPNLDRLAKMGRRFTSFYVAQPVCSASRAALLTGCYPNRIGLPGALDHNSRIGLHSNEVTIAELVKQKGYATAIFGKWHLGWQPQFSPLRHGFDEFYGLPYSNDMWPFHPEAKKGTYPDLPLLDGEKVAALNPDQSQLTTAYTERAVDFIERNRDQSFFLYLAHSMPHVPLFVSEKFKGHSRQGLYGDVLEELDWSVGRVLGALEKHRLLNDTLVIFSSDNGPWLSYGNHAGSAGRLREGKGTVWEGGVREPCIFSWPGHIPAGTATDQPAMTIDLLPTIAHLIGADLPPHKIDGRNIWPLIAGERDAKSPQEAYLFYYNANDLLAVRQGRWKLYVPQTYRSLNGRTGGTNGVPAKYEMLKTGLALFDLQRDVAEKHNVAARYPEVIDQLQLILERARADLGDDLAGVKGSGRREPGRATSKEHRPD